MTDLKDAKEASPSLMHEGSTDLIENTLSTGLKAALRRARRVILVANNPAIGTDDFKKLAMSADDVVVSFNTCIMSDFLSPEYTNVFVHGYHGQEFHFFGLPCAPAVTQLFEQAKRGCYTILVGVVNPLSALPNVTIFHDRIPLPALQKDYPTLRKSGKPLAGPSTGFNAMVVLEHLRKLDGYQYELLALGFSNEAGTLWKGHAWEYERAWLRHSGVECIVVSKPPKRWFGWFQK